MTFLLRMLDRVGPGRAAEMRYQGLDTQEESRRAIDEVLSVLHSGD
jgi:hypothetical protein